MRGYTPSKEEYLKRLRRIEGQVRGLQKMVDDDKYCIDTLTQVSAATRALQSVALGLLEDHLGHCVTQAVAEGGDSAAEKVREASDAIAAVLDEAGDYRLVPWQGRTHDDHRGRAACR